MTVDYRLASFSKLCFRGDSLKRLERAVDPSHGAGQVDGSFEGFEIFSSQITGVIAKRIFLH